MITNNQKCTWLNGSFIKHLLMNKLALVMLILTNSKVYNRRGVALVSHQ